MEEKYSYHTRMMDVSANISIYMDYIHYKVPPSVFVV